ncbi:hypothetical protein HMPREF3226_00329 [Prevotella corporis]|uniref:Uncharacterized protein n=1 Tax=Prevotella corporis TaxID=28128 RepID=A0A133QM93_9BACT|nr:hypothetical protein HMPREF3226_00329 [Prevotella corporis]
MTDGHRQDLGLAVSAPASHHDERQEGKRQTSEKFLKHIILVAKLRKTFVTLHANEQQLVK